MSRAAALLCLLLAATPGWAGGTLTVSAAWARATPPGAATGAAYCTLTNSGNAPDRLVEARTEAADSVMAHVTTLVGGVYRMRDGALQIPAHGAVTLAPDGGHLMLMGLKQPLREGTTLRLRLRFAIAGTVEVVVPVLAPTRTGP